MAPRVLFDETKADRAVRFIETHLRHTKGQWHGVPFDLMPWQRDEVIRPLFGTVRPDGLRQYRTAYIEVSRKNGKSEKGAALALKLLLADGEMGAEVYGAAKDRDQASIVFNIAASMVEQSAELSKRCQVVRSTKRIYVPKTDSVYRVIAADAAGSHGFNASGIVFDEVHTQPNRELWEVLETSTASRRQPLMIGLTTAGYDKNSLCWDLHVKALSLLKLRYPKRYAWADVPVALTDDPTFFAVVYGVEDKADWKVEATWKRANPSYGVTIQKDYFEKEVRKAADTPAYENTFRRLHLNQWTSQSVRWLPLELWDAAAGDWDAREGKIRAQLAGHRCYGGLDLASRSDLAAFILLFPPESPEESFKVLAKFWIPGANIERRVKKDRVPYDVWVRQGLITATEGDVIHYAAIRKTIEDEARVFSITESGYDDWGAEQLRQELVEGGLVVEPVRMGYPSMSAPTKELLDLVRERKIEHGGNPVLRWMADNLAVRTDPNGNVMPDKKKSTEKIDGMVALIIALQRAIANRPVERAPGQGFLDYLGERRQQMEGAGA